jgi:hypothetical protein
MVGNFAVCDDCWAAQERTPPVRLREPRGEYCGWCGHRTNSGIYRRALKADVPFSLTPIEARGYITYFRTHVLPGCDHVDTSAGRRIRLGRMTDADALFVANEFRRMEQRAAALSKARLGQQGRN